MRTTTSSGLPGLVLTILLLGGCTGSVNPDGWQRVVGVIEFGGGSAVPIQLPAEVRRGDPFTATVVTFGSGTCTRADGADVQVNGLTATITPYDLKPTGDAICTDDLASHPRTVTLRFQLTGEASIRVIGRTLHPDGPAVYETTIPVAP